MTMELFKKIFQQQLAKKDFDRFRDLEQPGPEATFKYVKGKVERDTRFKKDGDNLSLYQYWTATKISDFFADAMRKLEAKAARDARADRCMSYVRRLEEGWSVYKIAQLERKDRHAMARLIKRGIDYLNANYGTGYVYEDLIKARKQKMTQAEKQDWTERYKELHPSCSDDEAAKALELHIKDELKKKRTREKRTATIAKKAAQEEMSGAFEKLAEQAAEIEALKQALKDKDAVIADLKLMLQNGGAFKAAAPAAPKASQGGSKPVPEDDVPAEAKQQHELDVVSKKPGLADRVVAQLRADVRKCLLPVDRANAFAEMLLLDVKFTSKDQPQGWTTADGCSKEAKAAVAGLQKLVDDFRRLLKEKNLSTAYEASVSAGRGRTVKKCP